jgi:hypothetical protein
MANVKDYELIENTFKQLQDNSDISLDKKASSILATMYLEAGGVLDAASNCKAEACLVTLGVFTLFSTALKKRKYTTTDAKPCRWTNADTETTINNLNKYMRETLVTVLSNKCGLSSRG